MFSNQYICMKLWTCCGLRGELGTILFGGWCVYTRRASYTVMSGRPPRQHVEVNESDSLRSSSIWSLRILKEARKGHDINDQTRLYRCFVRTKPVLAALLVSQLDLADWLTWRETLLESESEPGCFHQPCGNGGMVWWHSNRQLLAWSCWGQGRIDQDMINKSTSFCYDMGCS